MLPKPVRDLLAAELQLQSPKAVGAGWDARFGPPPFRHGALVEALEVIVEPRNLGGLPGVITPIVGGRRVNREAQLSALQSQVGFVEGPNNENPFGTW